MKNSNTYFYSCGKTACISTLIVMKLEHAAKIVQSGSKKLLIAAIYSGVIF